MTAPALERCLNCGEGLVRFDPQTGEERCGNCGERPPVQPPLLGSIGQGRADLDAEREAPTAIAVAIVLVTVALGIAAWAASTYWRGVPS